MKVDTDKKTKEGLLNTHIDTTKKKKLLKILIKMKVDTDKKTKEGLLNTQ